MTRRQHRYNDAVQQNIDKAKLGIKRLKASRIKTKRINEFIEKSEVAVKELEKAKKNPQRVSKKKSTFWIKLKTFIYIACIMIVATLPMTITVIIQTLRERRAQAENAEIARRMEEARERRRRENEQTLRENEQSLRTEAREVASDVKTVASNIREAIRELDLEDKGQTEYYKQLRERERELYNAGRDPRDNPKSYKAPRMMPTLITEPITGNTRTKKYRPKLKKAKR